MTSAVIGCCQTSTHSDHSNEFQPSPGSAMSSEPKKDAVGMGEDVAVTAGAAAIEGSHQESSAASNADIEDVDGGVDVATCNLTVDLATFAQD